MIFKPHRCVFWMRWYKEVFVSSDHVYDAAVYIGIHVMQIMIY